MTELPSSTGGPHVYPMAPLIRSTLVLLYLALVLPLPAFAAGAMRLWLLVMVALGLVLVLALVSERVELSAEGVRVGPAPWCASVLKRGWQLSWGDVKALGACGHQPRRTRLLHPRRQPSPSAAAARGAF